MELTPEQTDALVEIGNVGMSKAAKQLSLLLGEDINMSVPNIEIASVNEAIEHIGLPKTSNVACISQSMSGNFTGEALLLFHNRDSQLLKRLLANSLENIPVAERELHHMEYGAMVEIGNIIISSCISILADMLDEKIQLTIPEYVEENITKLFEQHSIGEGSEKVVVITALLQSKNSEVTGALTLIFTTTAIMSIVDRVTEMINNVR